MPFFLPRGAWVYNRLVQYMRGLYVDHGYEEVITPQAFEAAVVFERPRWPLWLPVKPAPPNCIFLALPAMARDTDVRVIMVTGAGAAFMVRGPGRERNAHRRPRRVPWRLAPGERTQMSSYQPEETFTVGGFELRVHPYVAAPVNRFEGAAALQFGADFRVRFTRGRQRESIGLVQLIWPQTKIFPHTRPGAWNVDKRSLGPGAVLMERCLYGTVGARIGDHSELYRGEDVRRVSEAECWLIDTPRESSAKFDAQGIFRGDTRTMFAHYVVELSGREATILDGGMGREHTEQLACCIGERATALRCERKTRG